MSLSASEIAAVVAELEPLVGSRVEAVRVHAERALTLDLYGRAGPATLLVSAEPDLTRIHVAEERPGQPRQPYAFQALLRRELDGARLTSVEATSGDRVVTLRLEKGVARLALVAELTGRHGDVLLVSADGNVMACAGRNLSRRRRLIPGEPYVSPAHRPPETPEPPRFAPVATARFPLSSAIEAHYRAQEEERALAEERRRLREPIRAAVARARRALGKLAEEAARVPAAEADRRAADLIKVNLSALRRGAREVALTEYTADGPRETRLALDPALGPRENMERYYRRYRRIAESAARVTQRTQDVRAREEALVALLGAIDGAPLAELPRLEREARSLGAGPRPAAAPQRRREGTTALPYRQFQSLSGASIFVGRGAAQNDELTTRFARGNDLWLHVRGRPGAHVVLRLDKGKGLDQEGLLDAAHLAAHFSDARSETAPEVVYTRVKYVRKPRGAAPGAVTYSQERALALRIEPSRVQRLLASEAVEPD